MVARMKRPWLQEGVTIETIGRFIEQYALSIQAKLRIRSARAY